MTSNYICALVKTMGQIGNQKGKRRIERSLILSTLAYILFVNLKGPESINELNMHLVMHK